MRCAPRGSKFEAVDCSLLIIINYYKLFIIVYNPILVRLISLVKFLINCRGGLGFLVWVKDLLPDTSVKSIGIRRRNRGGGYNGLCFIQRSINLLGPPAHPVRYTVRLVIIRTSRRGECFQRKESGHYRYADVQRILQSRRVLQPDSLKNRMSKCGLVLPIRLRLSRSALSACTVRLGY